MKAITLTQPFATLVAIGAKHYETRSWTTAYRGPIAIHAAKGWPTWAKQLCKSEPFKSTLLAAGVTMEALNRERGHIIAIGNLTDIRKIDRANAPADPEYSFGDYTPGRFMWKIEDVRRIEPIAIAGNLGLWEANLCITCHHLDCSES